MSDLVKRLRKGRTDSRTELVMMLDEAGAEIERLQYLVKRRDDIVNRQQGEIDNLRAALRALRS